jgi:hypothetical protein
VKNVRRVLATELVMQGRAHSMSYREVSEWLMLCASDSESARVQSFLENMSAWAALVGGKPKFTIHFMTQQITDLLGAKPQYVDAVLRLLDAGRSIRERLVNPLFQLIESELRRTHNSPEWTITNEFETEGWSNQRYAKLKYRHSTWPNTLHVCLELGPGYAGYGASFEGGSSLKEIIAEACAADRESRVQFAKAFWAYYYKLPNITNGLRVKDLFDLASPAVAAAQLTVVREQVVRGVSDLLYEIEAIVTRSIEAKSR